MKRKMILFLIFSFFAFFAFSEAQNGTTLSKVKIQLSGGELEGRRIKTAAGNEGLVFLGVPFAESPIGNLRFSDPRPKRPWDGTWSALEYPPVCPQNNTASTYKNWSEMSEDCLFLNIFAPVDLNQRNGVIYYIHGGGWEYDSPAMFPPEVLVDNFVSVGAIFVTIQYRLGVFGFWSSGTPEASGNYAFKDMVFGLQWIQKEITKFGGDPNKVTLMGHSSGGSTVSLLSMIPMTKNLIHQVAILSGPGVGNDMLENSLLRYQLVTEAVGCRYLPKNIQRTLDCLKNIDPQTLMNAYESLGQDTNNEYGPIPGSAPRMDGPDGIIPYPHDMLIPNRHPIPMLIGTTNNEFSFIKLLYFNGTSSNVTSMCQQTSEKFPKNSQNLITNACKNQYVDRFLSTHNDSDHGFWRNQTVLVYEDSSSFANTFKEIDSMRTKNQPIWLYSFDYVKRGLEGLAPWHAMDMCWAVGIHCLPFDDGDRKIQSFYPKYFANFAKHGHPTPTPVEGETWDPVASPEGFNYLSINLQPKMQNYYHFEAVQFWNRVVPTLLNLAPNLLKLVENSQINDRSFSFFAKNENNGTGNGTGNGNKWPLIVGISGGIIALLIGVLIIAKFAQRRKNERKNEEYRRLLS